jgi:DMATS type aromatic prenyltransferase
MAGPPLLDHVSEQMEALCKVTGSGPPSAREILADLLGSAGSRPVSEPPVWPSNVADDHTPIEFSLAFNTHEAPTLRILAEALDGAAEPAANLAASDRFIARQAERYRTHTVALDRVRDLFATGDPCGGFVLWHSVVFRCGRAPEFKVYLNPESRGVERAPDLVGQAFQRLGLAGSYPVLLDQAARPGQLGRADRMSFLALDLHDTPHARVKLYLSHEDARIGDVARAASLVDGVDTAELSWFCQTVGGTDTFGGRPLVGSYTFLGRADRPVGYSVYVPIRDYVDDDAQARDRVAAVLDRYGFDAGQLDRAIAAVTRRPLHSGVGLIAHVSLRLGPPRPGVTVYLSSEAYRVYPPRRAPVSRTVDDPDI